jgi:hypothetical protein
MTSGTEIEEKVRMPFVSVVMPVYNQEKYVGAAVESILRQTFKDFEFIIVDDGSTDRTPEVLKSITDPRVRIVNAPHQGFLPALTRGVNESRGKWVARMDSDDISHPNRLQRQMKFLNSHPECLFIGSIYGILTPNDKYLRPRCTFDWEYLHPKDITLATRFFADPSAVFNREKSLAVGLYDPDFENEKPLWYRLLAEGAGVVLGEPLHYIRWQLGSHSRSEFSKRAATNYEVRIRYDPENATSLQPSPILTNNKLASIRSTTRCMSYYLLAGDKVAAQDIAVQLWRRYPINPTTIKLLLMAGANLDRGRFWLKSDLGLQFAPTANPW